MDKTPISIISGYLGSGKTTLLRRIIDNLDRKFAIIMNEFGEIGIDTKVIEGKNVNIAEIANGCVCCSMTGEFQAAVNEVIEKYHPEIIIVETTGVAEPDGIALDISESMPHLRLDSVITVADGDAIARFPEMGKSGAIQIEMADIILLNKVDLLNESQRVTIKTKLHELNKKAPIIETTRCNADIDLLFGLETDHLIKNVHGHKTNMQSFAYTIPSVHRDLFEEALLKIPAIVYRLKGFVRFIEDETYLLNFVAGRWELEPMQSDECTLVFIGENIEVHKKQILSPIQECVEKSNSEQFDQL